MAATSARIALQQPPRTKPRATTRKIVFHCQTTTCHECIAFSQRFKANRQSLIFRAGFLATAMRQKLAILSLLTAWFFATGSQWDFIQSFAWARMMVGYAKVMPLREAVAQTFDPAKPCPLCRAVSKAKQQQDRSLPPEVNLRAKLVMIFQPAAKFVATVHQEVSWLRSDWAPPKTERPSPPVPPPRGQA